MGQMEMLQLMKSNKLKKHIVWNIVIKLPFNTYFCFSMNMGFVTIFKNCLSYSFLRLLALAEDLLKTFH